MEWTGTKETKTGIELHSLSSPSEVMALSRNHEPSPTTNFYDLELVDLIDNPVQFPHLIHLSPKKVRGGTIHE